MARLITSTTALYEFLSARSEVKIESEGYTVVCPTHPDTNPSLWVSPKASGKVGLHCRMGCRDKDAIVAGLGLTWADMSDLEVNGGPVSTKTRSSELVNEDYLAQSDTYFAEAQALYPDSPADHYVRDRFKIQPDEAVEVHGLGFDPGSGLGFGWVHGRYKLHPRVVVPFRNFDGRTVGFQGRTVVHEDTANRWIGPTNPPGYFWSTVGVWDLGGDDQYWVVTEGPSDALTAVGVGVSAVCCRGASLAQNAQTVALLIAGLADKRVVLAGDADRGGEAFNSELGVALSEAGVQTHQLAYPSAA
jgi:putative DNA primase/helicase